VQAGGIDVLGLGAEQGGAQRQAAAEAPGRRHNVGLDAGRHVGIELAGAAVAALHLVRDEQNVLFPRDLGQTLQKRLVESDHAALALDGLEHHGADLVLGDQLPDALEIVGLGVDEARREGLEVLVVVLLPGRGQGRDRAAVEAVHKRDDRIAVLPVVRLAVLPRGLDGALVGLRAGVREEDLFHAGLLAEQLRELGARGREVEVGGVLELVQLGLDGRLPGLVLHAEDVDRDAAAEVDVFLARVVLQKAALALDNLDREAGVGVRDVLGIKLFRFHDNRLL